jgi:hypothetical protein
MINEGERLILKRLIDENECENNTETIRKLKHSSLIRDDITILLALKQNNDINFCRDKCSFLFTNYMDIFNKIFNNELDLSLMWRLLGTLEMIENGTVDQHEGSVIFGKILKEIYIDSAIRRGNNLDASNENVINVQFEEPKTISWKEYKNKKN